MPRGDGSSLGDRMKEYEHVYRQAFPRRLPVVIRVDGRCFSSYLRGAGKPFDMPFIEQMGQVAAALCTEIQGAVFAYQQSDEISVLVQDWVSRDVQPWFSGSLQKIVSVAAGTASSVLCDLRGGRPVFDARVFVLPSDVEVANYFLWRQRDAVRNSITMAAQAHFSHARLHQVTSEKRQEMLWTEAGVNWSDYPEACKRGQVAVRAQGEREVTYTDRRTGETDTASAYRSWWQVTPAPHFNLDLAGFLAATIPPMPSLATIGPHIPDLDPADAAAAGV